MLFNGQLTTNEIFASLYNMIISQLTFADNIDDVKSSLVDMSRVDGSLYGDTKLYISTDTLHSEEWGKDSAASSLLAIKRPPEPKVQAIKLDKFRQISVTVDNYLTKRAWIDEGAFSSFNSVILAWIYDTKRIYDATTFNCYIGTAVSPEATENIEIDLTTAVGAATGEEKNRIEGQVIAEEIAHLLSRISKPSRDYNDYHFMRSYSKRNIIFVWNEDAVAKIEKRDLPTIYHNEIVDKFAEYDLPQDYFGTINTAETQGAADKSVRSLIEQKIGNNEYFAGDPIDVNDKAPANTSYTIDTNILFKVMHPRSVPYMSSFEVGTDFFNPKSLTENHYLTWGHNTLQYLYQYPFITVKKK